MNVVWAKQPLPTTQTRSIFLAGPTPREPGTPSWRPAALSFIEKMGFDGDVFVPEPKGGSWLEGYEDQVEWEDAALNQADVILVWIPRTKTLPGLTTNDEWGYWKGRDPSRLVLGTPEEAIHVKYQGHWANKLHISFSNTLLGTCGAAVGKYSAGAKRVGGEVKIPLHIWNTGSFQGWYQAQKKAGNRLDDARVDWVYRVGDKKDRVFSYALWVDVFIASEDRHKVNEFILARPDISAVVGFRRHPTISLETEVVMVREFRSPAATEDGFIWELPAGSSPKPEEDPQTVAAHEFKEETGIKIDRERFRSHYTRQVSGTWSVHRAHLFSVELTEEEIALAKKMEAENVTHGAGNSELTYVRVMKLREIIFGGPVDWAMVGMIGTVVEHF